MGCDPATPSPTDLGFEPSRLQRVADFARAFVEDGRMVGTDVLVARHGQVALRSMAGLANREEVVPVATDSLWRIFSMTKPITSVTVMQLVEEGQVRLSDPLERFLPAFAGQQVFVGGTADAPETVPAERPITIADLLTHTAGLSYSILTQHPVDEMYRKVGLGALDLGCNLTERIDLVATLPLRHQPGTRWSYSMATDVLGRVVEVVDGRPFAEALQARILDPLGMLDTGFKVNDESLRRMTSCYAFSSDEEPALLDRGLSTAFREPSWDSGGGGLVSTMADYHRFCSALLGGGALGGRRVLGSRTVQLMTVNHLPDGRHLDEVGDDLYTPGFFSGCGFGLGFATVEDPAQARILATRGEASWGGMASTAFWIDPTEGIHTIFLAQLVPSSAHLSLRWDLRTLVNQALVD
ncbi:MAG: serine hydrolase [Acidimicrobiales bacterium]|nr:serine hydrolase [Acidimicrobiales bacterium]